MKKTTKKTTTSPAPATKPAKPPAKKKAEEPVAAPPTPVPQVVPPAPEAPPAAEPAVKPVQAKKVSATIVAQIDIGFGNFLSIRGDGPGLSWDKGVAMECVADNQWQIVLPESARPIVFKFLVNDLTWNIGDDYTVESGASVTLEPRF